METQVHAINYSWLYLGINSSEMLFQQLLCLKFIKIQSSSSASLSRSRLYSEYHLNTVGRLRDSRKQDLTWSAGFLRPQFSSEDCNGVLRFLAQNRPLVTITIGFVCFTTFTTSKSYVCVIFLNNFQCSFLICIVFF